MENQDSRKYKAAKKRVDDLKGFYNHLAIYLVVNVIIIGSRLTKLFSRADSFSDVDFENWLSFNTFSVAFFWGIGLAFHALKTFEITIFKSWEEKKIKEFMEKDVYNTNDDFKF